MIKAPNSSFNGLIGRGFFKVYLIPFCLYKYDGIKCFKNEHKSNPILILRRDIKYIVDFFCEENCV